MAEKYYSILTNRGKELEAASSATGTPVIISDFVIGDGNGMAVTPDPARTALVREVFRRAISKLDISKEQSNQWIAHLIIPADTGGFTVREAGLLTEDGELYAIANCAAIEKPQSGVNVNLQFRLAVNETASIELKVATGDGIFLRQDANLSDVPDKEKSRQSLDIYSKDEVDAADEKLREAIQNALLAAKEANDNADKRVAKSGDAMSGPLVISSIDAFRLKQQKRSFFFRFDGSNLYLLKTKSGDPDGTYDDSRPITVNADTGIVTLGAGTRVAGVLYVGDKGAWIANDGNIWGTRWNTNGQWLWDAIEQNFSARDNSINNVANRANDAWNKANDAQVYRVANARRGGQQYQGGSGTGQGMNWECPVGCFLSGINTNVSDGRGMGVYFRRLQLQNGAGGWWEIGD